MTTPAVPLYPYQRRWIQDPSRFKIAMFSRQSGKTFTTTLDIVDDCYRAWTAKRRVRWVILSRGERQAAEAMREGVKLHAQAYGMALDEVSRDFVAQDGTTYKELEITLPGGSRVTALPANPDTARGYSANVFLDEFARHQKSREIWGALFPVISAGHRIAIASTPNGKGNKFYEIMSGTDTVWSRHRIDIHQAVADGLPRDVEEMRAGLGDEDLWRQEYEVKWLDEALAWLDYDLINAAEDPGAGRPERYAGGDTYIGVDIGRRKDLWVAWVIERIGDVAWTREIRTLKRQRFSVQDSTLDELFERYEPIRIGMDQTGMGEKPTEDAQDRYGPSRVEGVLMTAPAKLRLASALKQALEDRKLRIPAGDRVLRADLHSIRKEVSITGTFRLLVEPESEGDGSHADRFWAAALAVGAADQANGPFEGQADDRVSPMQGMDQPPDAGGDAGSYRIDTELGMVVSPHHAGLARYG